MLNARSLTLAAGLLVSLASPSLAQEPAVTLFKVVTARDDIVIGLTGPELDRMGGRDAGTVARAILAKGELTAWRYAVRKAPNGDLQQAPSLRVGLLAHASMRVEPYATPLPVIAPE
ncbi:MAG TPA: hypothetical protein VIL65_16765 [Beijerinckiaceae bacterium]